MAAIALSRRLFLAGGAGAGAAALVLRPTGASGLPVLAEYHDVDLTTHEAQHQQLRGAGYRPLTVSIYGTAANPQFAAVWVQRTGPTWVMYSNIDGPGLQQIHDFITATGGHITQLSATGTAADPRYVVVIEQSSIGPSTLAPGLFEDWSVNPAPGSVQLLLGQAFLAQQQIPRAVAVYGSTVDPRYTFVLEPNPQQVPWNVDGRNDVAADLQRRLDAQVLQRARPAQFPVSPDQRYLSVYRGDELAGPWVAKGDLTAAAYATELTTQQGQGRYPLAISAGGSGSARRFSAVFVQSEQVVARPLTMTGAATSTAVDNALLATMNAQNVRQAALAVCRNRRLVYARTFTRGEPGYPVAQPMTYFRLASCSKTLTAMVIMRLLQDGRFPFFGLGTSVQSILNLRTPQGGPPTDPWFPFITIDQCLRHTSGLRKAFPELAVAGGAVPVTKAQLASYVAAQPLDFVPGLGWAYSNVGYQLLGMVIEKVLGTSFLSALQSRVLLPLNGNNPAKVFARIAPELPESLPANEARYDSLRLNVGPTVVSADGRILPMAYGADFDPRIWDSSGGLSMPAAALLQAVVSLSMTIGNPVLNTTSVSTMLANKYGFDNTYSGPPRSADKGGELMGLTSTISYTEGGTSYVAIFNREYVNLNTVNSAVLGTTWPTAGDLFPSVGLSTLP